MKRRIQSSQTVRVSPRKKRAQEKDEDSIFSLQSSSSQQSRISKAVTGESSLKCEKSLTGYTSDGMSFESLVEDDDMLPDISIVSPQKGKKYVRDDIVWGPWHNGKTTIYWPALVTSVKWPKVCFLFINEAKKPVYSTHHNRLISFDNSSRNFSLKEEGKKAYVDFLEAYELAVKYLCKKRLDPQLNARRFLTLSDHNDKIGQAKDCLFRLTGRLDSSEGGEAGAQDDDDDGVELFPDDECTEDKTQDIEKYEDEDIEKYEDEDKVRVKEILKELETLPSHMMVSSKELEMLREEAKKLLDFIKTEECFDHLMSIREGKTRSSRHIKFTRNQEVLGCLGPFTQFDDLIGQLLTVLDNHCDEYDAPEYKHNVMLPEAIIYGIQKLKNCKKLTAKKYFNQTSQKLGVKD